MNSRVTFFLICVLTKWFMLLDKIITSLFGIFLAHSSFWRTINHSKKHLKLYQVCQQWLVEIAPFSRVFIGKVRFSRVFDTIEQHLIFKGLYEPCLSVRVPLAKLNTSAFPPVPHDWVIKGRGMSSHVCVTGHVKDPMPLIEKRRGLSAGGRFPPSFIHQEFKL